MTHLIYILHPILACMRTQHKCVAELDKNLRLRQMSEFLHSPLRSSIIVYLVLALVLIHFRPAIMFDEYGRPKGFGCGKDCEFFNFPVVLFLLAILISFVFQWTNIYL